MNFAFSGFGMYDNGRVIIRDYGISLFLLMVPNILVSILCVLLEGSFLESFCDH